MLTREICKFCYRTNKIGFNVPDEIWNSVVPVYLRNNVVCIDCFTYFGDYKNIQWDKDIQFYPVSKYTETEC